MNSTKSSVLACVTSQYDCDRIIKTARQIADDCECELRVLSVLTPTQNYANISDKIEYLYFVSKQVGADMTILFNTDAAKATAEFAKENNAERIVTGMHDGGDDSFLVKFNQIAPDVSITMVDTDDIIYDMNLCMVQA